MMGLFLSIHYQHCDQALNCFLFKVGMGNNSGRPTHLSTARGESWAPSASRAPELCPHGRCAHPNSQINTHSPEIPSPPTPPPIMRLWDPQRLPRSIHPGSGPNYFGPHLDALASSPSGSGVI